MQILVVGNVISDVYLNLDVRSEKFEMDKNGVRWLDVGFNASEHQFFSRNSSLGGAAVTLEVLQKLGLEAKILGSDLSFATGDEGTTASSEQVNETAHTPPETGDNLDSGDTSYRYILVADDQAAYLAPSQYQQTSFASPNTGADYLYIDRSAELTLQAAADITAYLDDHPGVKLVIYLRNFDNSALNSLIPRAALAFVEGYYHKSELAGTVLGDVDASRLIFVTEKQLKYLKIVESISTKRIDVRTHLSAYSTAAATVLGSFILGYSVEDSLRLARLNLENSKLNSVLTLSQLQELAINHAVGDSLELTAASMMLSPKGILAADESGGSIHKKFAQLNIPDTYQNRRDYRNIFFTTPDLEKYVNGVILFDETARQYADNGQNYVDYLTDRRIIPGIKVDQGLVPFSDTDETYTKGLDGLPQRLQEYYQMGLRFAKWRAAFNVRKEGEQIITPGERAISRNCEILAEYAKDCQEAGMVPIVEPELVYDGNYSIDESAELTGQILDQLFAELEKKGVNLRGCILKVNMVMAGKQYHTKSTPEEVGAATAKVLRAHVPRDLAGVVFLSGGQTVDQATDNLAAIIQQGPYPWPVTFSFARALQDPALYSWRGNNDNSDRARYAFLDRLKRNSLALLAGDRPGADANEPTQG